MSYRARHLRHATALSLLLSVMAMPAMAQAVDTSDNDEELTLDRIVVLSAGEQLKQAPGVSTITSEDLEKQPVANDLSEIIRKMPGVNLTGTTSSGQRGNHRQIDIRGMGPENTLILIDGKPVLSRNSVRMGRAGERDSRGDSNWVPAEMVERIEVLRGPAAARYGSGASGGVVNIITKRPETTTGQFSVFGSMPQHSEDGYSIRANALIGGPITDVLSYRIIASVSKTDADDPDINKEAMLDPTAPPAAGREGVINKDLRGLLTYEHDAQNVFDFEAAYSRQGNIFSGDRQLGAVNDLINELARNGAETNKMVRTTLSATHRGTYDFADSNSYIQWEQTRNSRLPEGTGGSVEGAINGSEMKTITLDNVTAKSEWDIPLSIGYEQKLTLGGEFRGEWMSDGVSNQAGLIGGVVIPGTETDPTKRNPNTNAWMFGLYAEDNIYVGEKLILTPGLRADYHSEFGVNLSPSLNASYEIMPNLTLKAGVARAFKAPNLFQLNPNYVYYTRGNGCPLGYPSGSGTGGTSVGCYVVGNPDLDPETAINKEIGINYHDDLGWNAGVTYFHNDYKDRISSGLIPLDVADPSTGAGWRLRWENVPEAVVSGIAANLSVPVLETLTWSTNATYMIESKNKQDGQPLSLVPEYTINTALDWQAREDLTLTVSATHYGKISSPTVNSTTGTTITTAYDRDPYTLVNFGVKYDYNDNMRLSGGVTNVFDERVFREGSATAAGANTFNEPGRAFYLSLTGSF